MSKIYVLIGKAATGKDSVKRNLEVWGLHNCVSYTDRPMREGEINHVSYHFISPEEMDKLLLSDEVLETTEYLVDGKKFRYCYTKGCFSDTKDNICIMNPIGLKAIMQSEDIKNRLEVLYLTLDDEMIKNRYISREGDANDKALLRRLSDRIKRDQEDFKDLEDVLIENKITYHIYKNESSAFTASVIGKAVIKKNLLDRTLKIIHLKDEGSEYDGKIGRVTNVDDACQIHGTWGGLAVIPNVDEYVFI